MSEETPTPQQFGKLKESIREAIVVVVSILIAFSLDAWWDGTRDRDSERVLLEDLAADFHANQEELTDWVAYHERSLGGSVSLLQTLGSVSDGEWVEVPDTTLANAFFTPTYEPIRGTLEQAITSGSLSLIESEEVKRILLLWPEIVDDTREDEMRAREIVREELLPVLWAESDLESTHIVARSRVLATERGPGGGRYPPEVGSSVTRIQSTAQIRGMLTARNLSSEMTLLALDRIAALQDSILTLIEGELTRLR